MAPPSTDATDDPYDIDRPTGWAVSTDGETTAYERRDGTRRVEITEFSRGLSVYWWVDAYERDGDGWRSVEAGLGESFTRAADAGSAVESYLESVERSRRSGRDGRGDAERR